MENYTSYHFTGNITSAKTYALIDQNGHTNWPMSQRCRRMCFEIPAFRSSYKYGGREKHFEMITPSIQTPLTNSRNGNSNQETQVLVTKLGFLHSRQAITWALMSLSQWLGNESPCMQTLVYLCLDVLTFLKGGMWNNVFRPAEQQEESFWPRGRERLMFCIEQEQAGGGRQEQNLFSIS